MEFMQQFKTVALIAVVLVVTGCASTPKSPEVVKQMSSSDENTIGSATAGERIVVQDENALGQTEVIVGQTYFAASGRECRRLLDVSGTPISRVLCRAKNGAWQFARDLQSFSSMQTESGAIGTAAPKLASKRDAGTADKVEYPAVANVSDVSEESILMLNPDGSVVPIQVPSQLDTAQAVDIVADSSGFEQSNVTMPDEVLPATSTAIITSDATNAVVRELHANETLWSFARRTTGNALNWKVIAETNNISNTVRVKSGTRLVIPAELIENGG